MRMKIFWTKQAWSKCALKSAKTRLGLTHPAKALGV